MSEILSQDEIDALLKGSSSASEEAGITDEEVDVLSELCNISMNTVATFLLSKLKNKVTIIIDDLAIADVSTDASFYSEPLFAFRVELNGSVVGKTVFILKMNDVNVINDLLIGGDGSNIQEIDVDNIKTDILLDMVKEVIPEVSASITSVIQQKTDCKNPEAIALSGNNENLNAIFSSSKMVRVIYKYEISSILKNEVIQLIPLQMAKNFVATLLNTLSPEEDEPAKTSYARKKANNHKKQVSIQPVQFPNFDDDDNNEDYAQDENLEFILDVPLQISVELGRTKKPIKEILDLNVGSIIELNNLAEDFVDVLVNGKLIARGEVIVIDENFGVRVMELFTHGGKNVLGTN